LTVLFAAGLFTGAALTKHISVVGFSGSDTLQVFGQGIPKARSLFDLLPSIPVALAQGGGDKQIVKPKQPLTIDAIPKHDVQNSRPVDSGVTTHSVALPAQSSGPVTNAPKPPPANSGLPLAAAPSVKADTVYVVKAASPAQEDSQKSAILYYSALMSAFTAFSYSSLKYFTEKMSIKRRKKKAEQHRP
ncbi:MAG: hypothetical protein Q8896_14255, partial [Bacteroidota bacterium]|nr:hypothetical protein [Bacteroidota bacterium]